MADQDNNNTQEEEAPNGGGKKGAIAFVAIGLFCLVSSVTVGLLAFPSKEPAETQEEVSVGEVTTLMPVPQVLVNLRESNGMRLLQASMSLEISGTDEESISSLFNDMLPKIQDKLIKILSAYSAEDLDGGNRKDAIQTRVMQLLNEGLFHERDMEVAGVYFTEFVIQ